MILACVFVMSLLFMVAAQKKTRPASAAWAERGRKDSAVSHQRRNLNKRSPRQTGCKAKTPAFALITRKQGRRE
jgi:hypothetical protein